MENVTVVLAIRSDRYTAGKVNVIIRILVKRKVAKTLKTGIRINPAKDEKLSYKAAFAYILPGLLIYFASFLALKITMETTEIALLFRINGNWICVNLNRWYATFTGNTTTV